MKKEIMSWERCEIEFIEKIECDSDKIRAILKMGKVRLRFFQKQDADEETATLITEGYYDVIKELLIALLLKEGLKSMNHECLISYFKKKYPQYEYEIQCIAELKTIRNRITYDGDFINKNYLDKNRIEFEHIISLILSLIE